MGIESFEHIKSFEGGDMVWTCPDVDMIKVNVDVAYFLDLGRRGFGGLLETTLVNFYRDVRRV